MPSYAGYRNVRHFLDEQFRLTDTNQNTLAEAYNWRRSYVGGIYHGRFLPSPKRCDLISSFFNVNPNILRVLVGHASPPPDLSDKLIREIHDLASSLSMEQRRDLVKHIHAVKTKRRSK